MKTNINIDTIMNRIVKDFLVLCLFSLVGIVIFGCYKEKGDLNAGSMYGLIDLPFLPIIFISLGLTEVVKINLKAAQIWFINFTPIVFLLLCFWLSSTNSFMLIFNLAIVIIYQSTKSLINRKIANQRM